MTKIISLFNHKGGVSKTTTTFNLGWMLSEKGYKVLMVDTDPQCNLTGEVLSLSEEGDFEDFYKNENYDNLQQALSPVFDGKPVELKPAKCYEISKRENLFLLPGHIDFSDYDVAISIAQELTGSLKTMQNIPGAISHLLRITAKEYGFDYILIDMSPSVSATNANIFIQSDYFIVPCCPDYFCNMAINSLGKVIPNWVKTYNILKTHPAFQRADYKLPDTTPQFLGIILQRYRPKNGVPARSFRQWIQKISQNVEENLVPILKNNGMIVEPSKLNSITNAEEPYNIINVPDFNGLIAQSQKYNVPVFALKDDQLEQVGKVKENVQSSREKFYNVFSQLADSVIKLTK